MSIAKREAAKMEYAAALAAGRPPDFDDADLGTWVRAADELVEQGELELGDFAVRQLQAARPTLLWSRNMASLFDIMPEADPREPPFSDRFPLTAQTVARPGAKTAVVVFCGARQRIGMPLSMLHRWLSRWPVSLIYLRDPVGLGYLAGVESLGPDLGATLQALRRQIDALGAERIVCFGHSIGSYGALRYGLELGAEAVICMAGVINLKPGFNVGLNYGGVAGRAQARFPDEELDLRQLHQSAARPPRTWMVFSEHNWDDRLQAEHMAGLDGVVLTQVDRAKTHNVAVELMRAGRFDGLIDEAIQAGRPTR